MGFLGRMMKGLSGVARDVGAMADQYKGDNDFLEAVCAASALVAFADGKLEDSERAAAIRIITAHPVLSKAYDRNSIEQTLQTMLGRATDASGRHSLGRELDDIKSKQNAMQMSEDVYLIALDIAGADGNVGDDEKVVLDKIAKKLGVDTTKFDF